MDDKSEWAALDPRDAQIMALATQLNEIKAQQKQSTALASAAAENTGDKGNATKDYYPSTQVEKWRDKYDGPSKKGSND